MYIHVYTYAYIYIYMYICIYMYVVCIRASAYKISTQVFDSYSIQVVSPAVSSLYRIEGVWFGQDSLARPRPRVTLRFRASILISTQIVSLYLRGHQMPVRKPS